jgi:uncharacterized protein YbjT (DUF2867 family)
VDVIFHLAGAEHLGTQADLMGVDIEGTRSVAKTAVDAGVRRIFYLSHLGADRASAYPLLKAKAIAESYLVQCGVPHTIFRSAVIYGQHDHFTTELSRLLRISPLVFLMPGDGSTALQPIWVEDLVVCLTLALEDESTANRTFSIGGPEFLTFRQIVETISSITRRKRWIVPVPQAYLRILTVLVEGTYRKFPLSIFWQDYLAADRTCELDTLPRLFGLIPERFNRQLGYLTQPGPRKNAAL